MFGSDYKPFAHYYHANKDDETPFITPSITYDESPQSIIAKLEIKCNIGNTPLHHVISMCKSADEVLDFIKTQGESAAAAMAKIVNDYGIIPLDTLSNHSDLSEQEKTKIYKLLEPLTVKCNIKPLTEPIDVATELKTYNLSSESQLYKNLKKGMELVNECRKGMESTTHPQFNHYAQEKKNEIIERKGDMRAIKMHKAQGLIYNYVNEDVDFSTAQERMTQLQANIPEEKGVGNCEELSFMMKKRFPQGEVYDLPNGGHAFFVIGRDPNSNPNDYKTWGENAVVCDPWKGDVFPASEIPKKLTAFRRIRNPENSSIYYNVCTSYNPAFHTLAPFTSIYEQMLANAREKVLAASNLLNIAAGGIKAAVNFGFNLFRRPQPYSNAKSSKQSKMRSAR